MYSLAQVTLSCHRDESSLDDSGVEQVVYQTRSSLSATSWHGLPPLSGLVDLGGGQTVMPGLDTLSGRMMDSEVITVVLMIHYGEIRVDIYRFSLDQEGI